MEERATNADPRPLSQLASSTKTPADYLASLPPPPPSSLADRPLAAAELARVASGQPLPPLDASRFRLDPPPASRWSDPGAWRAALDNARAQLEHQHTRLLNLELLLQHGPRAAAAAAAHAEAGARAYQRRVAAAASDVAAVNRARKLAQTGAAAGIEAAEAEWRSLVATCGALEGACATLEAEVAAAAAAAPAVATPADAGNGLPPLPGEEEGA